MTTQWWQRGTLLIVLAVAGYGASLVLVPQLASGLFEALGFGMREGGIVDDPARSYVLFLYGVLGSVIVGWMTLIAAVVAGPLKDGNPWAWPALVVSVSAWFVLDTGFSLTVGEWQHALFNLTFLAALGLPLLMWRRTAWRTAAEPSSGSR